MSWSAPSLARIPARVGAYPFPMPWEPGGQPGGAPPTSPPAGPSPPYFIGPGAVAQQQDQSALLLWAIPLGLVLVGGVLLGAGVFRRLA